MLGELHVEHLGVIERLDLVLGPGLTAVTGETGAGKTMLVEALELLVGGRADASIPFRPDHGQDILDDLKRRAQPGYPAIGRLKGLAELRGIMTALTHPEHGLR